MDNSVKRPGIAGWVNRAPEGSAQDIRRFYSIVRVGYPMGTLVHCLFIVLFWHVDQPMMAVFNVISTAIFAWTTWLAWTLRDIKFVALFLLLVEIPLHAIFAVYYMGFAPFFSAYLLLVVMIAPLVPYFARRTRFLLSMAYSGAFVVINVAAFVIEPARPLSQNWNIFFLVFNSAPAASFIGVFATVYETATNSAEKKLEHEFDRAENLLLNILPAPIAARLKDSPELIADEHSQVSVLFADIVNFTETTASMEPADLVQTLNMAFSRFDALVEKHGCEKIKTIGDAYMVVAGLPDPRPDHAQAMVALALDMIDVADEINASGEFPFSLRIGINSGPVVAGVIGDQKFAYDLWGDTVNVAARMESNGQPGEILITDATRVHLNDTIQVSPPELVDIKGKGEMATYTVTRTARRN